MTSTGRIALRERLAACKTTGAACGRLKSCGPDASTLASSLAEARSAQPGWTKPSIRKATVAKEPDRRGEHEGNRDETICVRERPGDSGGTRLLVCFLPMPSAHEAAGATGTGVPHALLGGSFSCKASGRMASRGARRRVCYCFGFLKIESEICTGVWSTWIGGLSIPATAARSLSPCGPQGER